MTLYDLMSSTTMQGDIDIRVVNDDGDIVDSEYYDSVDDLRYCEIDHLEDMENLEVKYIYAGDYCMVIELEETED